MDAPDQEIGACARGETLHLIEDDLVQQEWPRGGGLGPDHKVWIRREGHPTLPDVTLHDPTLAFRIPVVVHRDISLNAGDFEIHTLELRGGDPLHPIAEEKHNEKHHGEEIEMRASFARSDLAAQTLHGDGGDGRAQHTEECQACRSGNRGDLDEGNAVAQGNTECIPSESRKERPPKPLDSNPCCRCKQCHDEISEGAEPRFRGIFCFTELTQHEAGK